jgi:hypothetical protein
MSGACHTCKHFGYDDDGGEPEFVISWPICKRNPAIHNLKGFPFKNAVCHQLDFWHSEFACRISGNNMEEVNQSMDKAYAAYWEWFKKTYPQEVKS